MSNKQFGLIIPSKNKKHIPQAPVARPSIFADDSDSDTPKPMKPTGLSSQAKARKQDIGCQNKAIEEDPTVFQYDEIYEEMDQKRKDSKLARKDLEKKPKYITKLLAAADKRKRENERRIERQVQKEREAEGDQFRDKEAFVTSSYKKKLEEMKALEEQEKREEYLESIGDVKKQGNLDGFYRHLYDQKVNYEDEIAEDEIKIEENEIKDEPASEEEGKLNETKEKSEKSGRKRRHNSEDKTASKYMSSSDNESENGENHKKIKQVKKKRTYRSRKDSDNNEDEELNIDIKKEHLPSNLDADSDFSIDSSDSEDETSSVKKVDDKPEDNQTVVKGNVLSDNAAFAKANENKDKIGEENTEETKVKDEEIKEDKPKKPKVDIWKKRTVGVVFDEAVKRYFERKAARDSAMSG